LLLCITVLATAVLPRAVGAQTYIFTHLAGTPGGAGVSDGLGRAARFNGPDAVAVDAAGVVYVADTINHTIRKITPAGQVTTIAGLARTGGSADGTGSAARFFTPGGVAVDASGNVFVADTGNHTIRKITPAGVVTTFVGSPGSSGNNDGTGIVARFSGPTDLAFDASGVLFVADTGNSTIRKVTTAGVVSTFAGLPGVTGTSDGTGAGARFNGPKGIAIAPSGTIYVSDTQNHTIRAITPAAQVTTLAGLAGVFGWTDATGASARFRYPEGASVDAAGVLYVADGVNYKIRRITSGGVVTTLAGSGLGYADGTGAAVKFDNASDVAVDLATTTIYVADSGNDAVRALTAAGVTTTFAGEPAADGAVDGTGTAARFDDPRSLAVDPSTGDVFVADAVNHVIRKITAAGVTTTLAGEAGVQGSSDGTGTAAHFAFPSGIGIGPSGNLLVSDTGNHTIRKVTQAGVVTTLAGAADVSGSTDGTGSAARFNSPRGLGVDATGDIYVADSGNHTIRKITASGVVTTLAGVAGATGSTDGIGSAARFNTPYGVAARPNGTLYVADRNNHTIRRISTTADVTTLAGQAGVSGYLDGIGSAAGFRSPQGVGVDSLGLIYVADTSNSMIRTVTSAGVVTTVGGSVLAYESVDGAGSYARFAVPGGIAADATGNIYVADTGNNAIRKGTLGGATTGELTVLLQGTGSGTVTSTPSGILCGTDCHETLTLGTVVTLNAVATFGSVFTGWTGTGCSGTNECVMTFDGSTAVAATFESSFTLSVSKTGTGTGTVNTVKAGIACGSDCSESYPVGVLVTLTATADAGSAFAGWAGGGCSGTGSCTVTMNAATSVVATFNALPPVTLTVQKTGTGALYGTVTSAPAGISCGADCNELYALGTAVTLTASTSAGIFFAGWSGGGCSGTGTCVVTMNTANTVQAQFSLAQAYLTVTKVGTGTGTVTSSPAGISCGSDCGETYTLPNTVTLTAVPNTGSTFAGWSGACTGTGTCVVTLTVNTTATATFNAVPPAQTLTVSTSGTGSGTVTSSPAGILCGADCSESYANGTVVTLTATPTGGSIFAGWSGSCGGTGTCVVTMTVARSVTATFTTSAPSNPLLSILLGGTGSGSVTSTPLGLACPDACAQDFPSGTVVTLQATPSSGSTFSGWSGGGCTGTGACVLTLTASTTVAATFTSAPPPTQWSLTVLKTGSGTGSVTSAPAGISCGADCGETYADGTVVTLTANASSGSFFAGWSGSCAGTGACVVPMTSAKAVAATFNTTPPPTQSTLTVLPSGTGSGAVTSTPPGITCGSDCTETYANGIAVTLMATADAGSTFEGWSGGGCSGTGACTVSLAASTSVTATFTASQPPTTIHTVYLAEGATSSFLDTRLALLNMEAVDATATLTFQPSGAAPIVVNLPVPAQRRVTFDPKNVPGLVSAEFATKIESPVTLIVDRTMSWDPTGYGAHAEKAIDAPAFTWYLAEGATHSGFNLFYLLQNPNPVPAQVLVRYFTPTGAPLEKTYTLPPTSRTNIWVNVETFPGLGAALASTDVSAQFICLGDVPIIVERALYLDRPGQTFAAGHESAGVTAPATEWFLAEGATGAYFDLFVLVANTTNTDAAVEANFLLPNGTVVPKTYTVKANSRFNIWVDQQDPLLADTAVSTFVQSTNGVPIIVERALWWPGTFDQWYEAHNSPGATTTGITWAMAEGEVGGPRDIDTFILLANLSPAAGPVDVTLVFENGTRATKTFTVNANSRFNVDVRTEFPQAIGTRFGAVVESTGTTPVQLVVERAMYWDANGQVWAAGTNVLAHLVRVTRPQ